MKRREFLTVATGCACGMLTQRGLTGQPVATFTGPVKVGELKSFTREGLDDRFLRHGFFLVRGKDRLFALSIMCTHQPNAPLSGRVGAEKLVCPNHGSQFAMDGTVIRGPARRNLSRFAITLDSAGQVMVNTSKPIAPDQIDEADAFVKIS